MISSSADEGQVSVSVAPPPPPPLYDSAAPYVQFSEVPQRQRSTAVTSSGLQTKNEQGQTSGGGGIGDGVAMGECCSSGLGGGEAAVAGFICALIFLPIVLTAYVIKNLCQEISDAYQHHAYKRLVLDLAISWCLMGGGFGTLGYFLGRAHGGGFWNLVYAPVMASTVAAGLSSGIIGCCFYKPKPASKALSVKNHELGVPLMSMAIPQPTAPMSQR